MKKNISFTIKSLFFIGCIFAQYNYASQADLKSKSEQTKKAPGLKKRLTHVAKATRPTLEPVVTTLIAGAAPIVSFNRFNQINKPDSA